MRKPNRAKALYTFYLMIILAVTVWTVRVLAAPIPLLTSITLGASIRNDLNEWVGMKITPVTYAMSVSYLCRYKLTGNSQTHSMKLVRASDNTVLATGSVNMSGGTVGQFTCGSITPVTVNAGSAYYVVSQETDGGDNWSSFDNEVTTTTAAVLNSSVRSTNLTTWTTQGSTNTPSGPVDVLYEILPQVVAGTDRNVTTASTESLTGVEGGLGTVTARGWSIISGPGSHDGTLSSTTNIAADFNATVLGAYVLRYSATDGTGTYTDDVTLTVVAAPIAPSGLNCTTVSVSAITCSWTDNSSDETGFLVQFKREEGGIWSNFPEPEALNVETVDAGVTTYAASGTQHFEYPSFKYYFRVAALRDNSRSAWSNVAMQQTTAAASSPPTPTGLSCTGISDSRIDCSWNNVAGETHYRLEGRVVGDVVFKMYDPTNIEHIGADVTSFSWDALHPNTEFEFRLISVNEITPFDYRQSLPTATVTASTLAIAGAPNKPMGLGLTVNGKHQITLNWTDAGGVETGFYIERRKTAFHEGTFQKIAEVGANVTTFVDTGLEDARVYSYRVNSFNATGRSGYSTLASATTGGAEGTPVADAGGPYTVYAGEPLVLDGRGSRHVGEFVNQEGQPYVTWTLGDGSNPAHILNPTHAYLAPGVYTVSLTVRNNGTSSSTDTATVTVSDFPTASTFYNVTSDTVGNELITAVNACVADTSGSMNTCEVRVSPGLTFTNLILPHRTTTSTGYITIKSTGTLPAAGTRVGSDATAHAQLFQLRTNGDFGIGTAVPIAGSTNISHHYRIKGVRVTKSGGIADLIHLGYDHGVITVGATPPQRTSQYQAHHIILDHLDVYPSGGQLQRAGIRLNSAYTSILNSNVRDIVDNNETSGIGGYNGGGPFALINNFVTTAGINILFGGARSGGVEVTPQNIVARNNYLKKETAWYGTYGMKNHYEHKQGRDAIVDGNFMEYSPGSAQFYSIIYTQSNDSYIHENMTSGGIQNIQTTNNYIKDVSGGGNVLGMLPSNGGVNQGMAHNILYGWNIWENVNSSVGVGHGHAMVASSAHNVFIIHNTFDQNQFLFSCNGVQCPSNRFLDNIARWGGGLNSGDGYGTGAAAYRKIMNFEKSKFAHNLVTDVAEGTGSTNAPVGFLLNGVQVNDFSAQFTNYAAKDFSLAASSSGNNAAYDNTDMGADINKTSQAKTDSINGIWPYITFDSHSVSLNGTNQYLYRTLPNTAPFTSLTNYRIEFRMHDFRVNHSVRQRVLDGGQLTVFLEANGSTLRFFDYSASGSVSIDLSSLGDDVVVRVQRNSAENKIYLEAWNRNGTLRVGNSSLLDPTTNTNFGNSVFAIGCFNDASGEFLQGRFAFIRWYTTLVNYQTASAPPITDASTGDLAHWDFEENLTDTSGRGLTLTGANSPSFTTTITFDSHSVSLNGTNQYLYRTLPNTAPFTSLTNYRIEFRMHDFRVNHSVRQRVLDGGQLTVFLEANGSTLRFFDYSASGSVSIDLSSLGDDVVVRVQRNSAENKIYLEAWNRNGTLRVGNSSLLDPTTNTNFGNSVFAIGCFNDASGEFLQGRFAFIRWYTTLVNYQTASAPPITDASTGDLAHWDFEENLTDTSGRGLTLTGANSPSFTTTP